MPCALENLIKQSMCFSSLDKRQHIQHLELAQIPPPPDTGRFLHGISSRHKGKQGSKGNRAKQDTEGAGRELSPGRAHSRRRGTAPSARHLT